MNAIQDSINQAQWVLGCLMGVAMFGVAGPIIRILDWLGRAPSFVASMAERRQRAAAAKNPLRTYTPTSHDVFVAAHVKSGTNWTMQIAVQIAYKGRAVFEHIHDLVPWPEIPERARFAVPLADGRPQAACPTGLRVIKTHLALGAVPYSSAARYVCVVRDPKDVFVSSYHFIRSVALGPAMPSVASWLDTYLSPDTPHGSWVLFESLDAKRAHAMAEFVRSSLPPRLRVASSPELRVESPEDETPPSEPRAKSSDRR